MEAVLTIEIIQEPQPNLEENENPSILKDDFYSRTDQSIFISIAPVLWDLPYDYRRAILQIPSSGKPLMYSKKSVGPRLEPWGTPALIGYSCEDFPFRTNRSHQLLRKEEIRSNIWPEIP